MSDETAPEGKRQVQMQSARRVCSSFNIWQLQYTEIILMSFGLSSRVRQPKSRRRGAPLEASTMVSFQRCHEVERHAARNAIDEISLIITDYQVPQIHRSIIAQATVLNNLSCVPVELVL